MWPWDPSPEAWWPWWPWWPWCWPRLNPNPSRGPFRPRPWPPCLWPSLWAKAPMPRPKRPLPCCWLWPIPAMHSWRQTSRRPMSVDWRARPFHIQAHRTSSRIQWSSWMIQLEASRWIHWKAMGPGQCRLTNLPSTSRPELRQIPRELWTRQFQPHLHPHGTSGNFGPSAVELRSSWLASPLCPCSRLVVWLATSWFRSVRILKSNVGKLLAVPEIRMPRRTSPSLSVAGNGATMVFLPSLWPNGAVSWFWCIPTAWAQCWEPITPGPSGAIAIIILLEDFNDTPVRWSCWSFSNSVPWPFYR